MFTSGMSHLLRIWLVVAALLLAFGLGEVPLIDVDEGRNAEVARAMAESNDYAVPRLNGLPYLDKPVLYFAAAAGFIEILGPTELAVRLPAYLFTLATAVAIFLFVRRLRRREADGGSDREAAYVAALAFLSMPLTMAFARIVIFDSALTFFSVVALFTFHLSIETGERRWSIAAWVAMGFAILTKGPVIFLLVLAVAVPYAWHRKAVRLLFPPAGVALFGLVVAPWVWEMTEAVPEFLRYVLVTETVERTMTPALDRTGPVWYFVPYLLAGALPWSVVAIFSWKKLRRPDPVVLYCLLAIAIPFVFFSLSQSKRPQYILPLMAPLSVLIGRMWREMRTRAAAVSLVVVGLTLATAPWVLPRTEIAADLIPAATRSAIASAIVFVAAGALVVSIRRRELVVIALTLPLVLFPLTMNPVYHAIAERRSAKEFAANLAPHVGNRTRVIGVEQFEASLPFYLQTPIILITDDARELTSNYLMRRHARYAAMPGSTLRPLEFFTRSLRDCCTPRIYIVDDDDAHRRRILESLGWRVIAVGDDHLGYKK